jgi:hypothetical protein
MTRHSRISAVLAAAFLLPLGATAAETAAPAAKPAKAAESTREKIPAGERQCSMPSSPRLQKKNDDCSEAKGSTRWHLRHEIDDTGQTDMGEALRRLDPRIQ